MKTYSNAIATHPLDRYVWALEYVDAPIIRYRDGNVNGELDDAGDSSLYYLHDANFNVTGLVDRAETAVVERYMYEPYGRATVLNGADDADENVSDWTVDSDPDTSDWSNEVLYAGYRRDAESALYHVRNRYYHPTLGRWLSRDTIGYMGGIHLVAYLLNSPLKATDPEGLLYGGDQPQPGRGRPRYEPNGPTPLTPPLPPPPTRPSPARDGSPRSRAPSGTGTPADRRPCGTAAPRRPWCCGGWRCCASGHGSLPRDSRLPHRPAAPDRPLNYSRQWAGGSSARRASGSASHPP